jgi:hypothetical protein
MHLKLEEETVNQIAASSLLPKPSIILEGNIDKDLLHD